MRKVLVIDEPETVSLIERSIGNLYDVVWVPRGEEIRACLQRENPDLVLMHYEASECARYGEILKGIRNQKPDVPIILMSGEDILRHAPVTANGFIFKPFLSCALKDLLEMIESHECE